MASFVEECKMIDLKTLSDGLNISDTGREDQTEEEDLEQREGNEEEKVVVEGKDVHVSDIIEEDASPDPSEESETRLDVEFPKSERSKSGSQTPDEDLGVTDLLSQMTGELKGSCRPVKLISSYQELSQALCQEFAPRKEGR